MIATLRGLDRRTIQLLDGIAVFWVVFWLVLASATAYEIWQLTRLSDTGAVSAVAIERAGQALEDLSDIPLIGDSPREVGEEVRAAAAQLNSSAEATRADVRRLSILLGLSVFLIPVTPVLGLYLPLRLSRSREVASLRRSLRDGRDARLDAYLAQRALTTLPYADLLRLSRDPQRDLESGNHATLADAELHRLGLGPAPRS